MVMYEILNLIESVSGGFPSYYCYKWKLKINTENTKVIIFSYGRLNKNLHFYLNNTELEILNEFRYLGAQFSRTGSINIAKNTLQSKPINPYFL